MTNQIKPVEKAGESLEERAEAHATSQFPITGEMGEYWGQVRDAALWGLKQGEEECAGLCASLMAYGNEKADLTERLDTSQAKCEALEARVGILEGALKAIAAAGQKTQLLGMDVNPKHGLIHCPSIAREALTGGSNGAGYAENHKRFHR